MTESKNVFCNYVDEGEIKEFIEIENVALEELRNCNDILPADSCNMIGIEKGSTYAEAIEFITKKE